MNAWFLSIILSIFYPLLFVFDCIPIGGGGGGGLNPPLVVISQPFP